MQVIDALSWAGFGLIIAAGVARTLAVLRLRRAHFSKWEELGRPSLLPIPMAPGSEAARKVLWARSGLEELKDNDLTQELRASRLLATLALADFALLVGYWAYKRLT